MDTELAPDKSIERGRTKHDGGVGASTCRRMSKALSHVNTAKVEMEGIFCVCVCVDTSRSH